ncbi:hypothetical protein ACFXOM_01020 [Streptomyces sp. NPDC059169]|uniref:hypothetical protein n=1 Tax=unclassified Streptomyces TaxID=2593676 RepID=UPI00367D75B9
MSRETDSSSSGPQGGGGAAYPSGTPPYGSRQYPSLHPTQDAPEERTEPAQTPDEPKTETTLTTRIRINIPGSRPIPPVVMRTPLGDVDKKTTGESAAERTGSTPRPPVAPQRTSAGAGREAAHQTEATEKPAEEKTSDWFAPRKPVASTPSPSATPPSGSPPSPGRGHLPGQTTGSDDTGAHRVPGIGDTGTHPMPAAAGSPQAPGAPRFTDPSAGPGHRPRSGLDDLASDAAAPGRATPPSGPSAPGETAPTGPTAGPVTGGSPFAPGAGGAPRMSDDTAVLTPQPPAPEPGPAGPPGPIGNVSGDTLNSGIPVVPPQQRSPFAPAGPDATGTPWPAGPAGADFSDPDFPVPGPATSRRTTPSSSASAPADSAAPAASAAPSSGPVKKGRSKLVLAAAGVLVLLGVAYGAGLLLNHSDVPKGTTVLGVDIGGGTKEEAVSKLDAALGKRAHAPLQLTIGGQKTQLAPDKAGLSLDSQATVRAAAGSDYNPVSVIGSLLGGERVAQPVIPVDEEKLGVALSDLAGASGSASEGTIRFEPGKAVPVPGKSGKALDVQQSMISVRDAYRAQVETGRINNVELPVATREPTITQTELDRAMKEFAEPAMSGLITIKAGSKEIQFGPSRSLPKILSMKAINGRLVEVYDKKAIDELLDGVFDGIMITKGDGAKHEVSADDVASAMQKALLGKTPTERTETIALDPQG